MDKGISMVLYEYAMPKFIFVILLLALNSCDRPHSNIDFDEESRRQHSLPELLSLHDKVVEAQGKDIYFIGPIGQHGRDGLIAVINRIEDNGSDPGSYNNIELVFGVANAAKNQTDYDMCKDREVVQRLLKLATNPASHPGFGSLVSSICKLRESS